MTKTSKESHKSSPNQNQPILTPLFYQLTNFEALNLDEEFGFCDNKPPPLVIDRGKTGGGEGGREKGGEGEGGEGKRGRGKREERVREGKERKKERMKEGQIVLGQAFRQKKEKKKEKKKERKKERKKARNLDSGKRELTTTIINIFFKVLIKGRKGGKGEGGKGEKGKKGKLKKERS